MRSEVRRWVERYVQSVHSPGARFAHIRRRKSATLEPLAIGKAVSLRLVGVLAELDADLRLLFDDRLRSRCVQWIVVARPGVGTTAPHGCDRHILIHFYATTVLAC